MGVYLQQTWSILAKDLRQWVRDPQAAAGLMLLALVLMLVSTVMFGYGGDEWAIGLVVESDGPDAQALAQAIETARGAISPYFRIITRDADQARQLVNAGRLHMVATIPADLDARLAAGEIGIVETQLFNINTDMTKNARLRLDHAIQDYLIRRGKAPVMVQQFTTRTEDIWRRAFIAAGAVMVALLAGASLNTAIIVAREWEHHTAKEIALAPHLRRAVSLWPGAFPASTPCRPPCAGSMRSGRQPMSLRRCTRSSIVPPTPRRSPCGNYSATRRHRLKSASARPETRRSGFKMPLATRFSGFLGVSGVGFIRCRGQAE